MASDLVVDIDNISVSQSDVIIAEVVQDVSVHEVDPVVILANEEFVLSSGGMYGNNGLIGAIPSWILDAVQEQLTNGDGNLMQVLLDMRDLMGQLELGVNQAITEINTSSLSQNALTTSIASQIDMNRAEYLNTLATRVTAEESSAIAAQAIHSTFGGNADAYIGNIAATYVDANSAIAQDLKLVTAELNGVSASIATLDSVVIEQGSLLNSGLSQLQIQTGATLADLQRQIDGSITTYFQAGIPTLINTPASTWTTDVLKNNHLGDLYYDDASGFAYRFTLSGATYGWTQIVDTNLVLALANASTAQATADGKSTVFYSDAPPVGEVINGITQPIGEGDIWINATSKITKVFVSSLNAWVDVTNTATQTALAKAAVLEETNDGVIKSFFQPSPPASPLMTYGDWWVDTDSIPKTVYRFEDVDGKNVGNMSWVAKTNDIIGNSFLNADKAQTTAESKATVYYNTVAPSGLTAADVGDQWVNTTTYVIQMWDGAQWKDTTNATANAAYVEAGRSKKLFNAVNTSPPTAEGIGDLWVVADRWYTTSTAATSGSTSTAYGKLVRKWSGVSWVDITNTEAKSNSLKWTATSSKLITGPNGQITGWTAQDGSEVGSSFKIQADKFEIVSSSGAAATPNPFTIDTLTGKIRFNGEVSFTGVTGAPVINKTTSGTTAPTSGMNIGDVFINTNESNKVYIYTSSGWTLPPTGTRTYAQTTAPTSNIMPGDIWYDTDDNNKPYRYNGSSWVVVLTDPATYINANTTTINGGKITTGSIYAGQIHVGEITANLLSADAINGKIINGATINGANINGAVIKASWIDLSSNGVLTNWSVYTLAEAQATPYLTNCAKLPDGTYIVDSLGHVRLPGTNQCFSSPNTVAYSSLPNLWTANYTASLMLESNIRTSSSYMQSNTNRIIKNTGSAAVMSLSSSGIICSLVRNDGGAGLITTCSFQLNGLNYTASITYTGGLLNGGSLVLNCSDGWVTPTHTQTTVFGDVQVYDTVFSHDGFNFTVSYTSPSIYPTVFPKWVLSFASGNHGFILRDFDTFMGHFSLTAASSQGFYTNTINSVYASIPLFQIF